MRLTDDEIREAYSDIVYDYEDIRQAFLKDYGPETLKSLNGDELLKRLFASKDFAVLSGRRGLFVWLEHGNYNVPKGTFGSGRDMAFQNGVLMYHDAVGKFAFDLYGTQPKKTIDRAAALSYAENVKNVIVEACEYIDSNLFDNIQYYEAFDTYLKKLCNRSQPNPYWDRSGIIKPSLLKYFHIYRPDVFSEFYVSGYQNKIAVAIGVDDLNKYSSRVVRNGRLLLGMKKIDDDFDSVRFAMALYRLISNEDAARDAADSSAEHGVVDPNDDIPLNVILYGPPGTGKTYEAIKRAVEIIEGKSAVKDKEYSDVLKSYRKYEDEGRIKFTTFHQSYGYEEFIEGIKPVFDEESEDSDLKYTIEAGVFKEFCENAKNIKQSGNATNPFGIKSTSTVWKISLDGAGRKKSPIHKECLDNGYIRIGWDSYGDDLATETKYNSGGKGILDCFIDKMRVGNIVLSCYSETEIDAIGVVTGEYEWHDEFPRLKRMRKVNWLYKWEGREKFNIVWYNNGNRLNNPTLYRSRVSVDDVIKILNDHCDIENKIEYDYSEKFVFIIDEINRGNISKIFGELITLVEPSKRLGASEPMECILPYSKKPFGIPKNVYIIGTMNTADRSLVQLDAALRRRFEFEERMPDYGALRSVLEKNEVEIEDIDLDEMLSAINERITFFIDRERQIGHSYFIDLNGESTISDLANIFIKKIIPLLQEYFFDDYATIKKVLGNNNFIVKKNITDFVLRAENADSSLYEINPDFSVFEKALEYKKIYISKPEESESDD